jgi:hypothetical protein
MKTNQCDSCYEKECAGVSSATTNNDDDTVPNKVVDNDVTLIKKVTKRVLLI